MLHFVSIVVTIQATLSFYVKKLLHSVLVITFCSQTRPRNNSVKNHIQVVVGRLHISRDSVIACHVPRATCHVTAPNDQFYVEEKVVMFYVEQLICLTRQICSMLRLRHSALHSLYIQEIYFTLHSLDLNLD